MKNDISKIMNEDIADIAKEFLNIDTLETRNNDNLDFYTLSVWNIKQALEYAYGMGIDSVYNKSESE